MRRETPPAPEVPLTQLRWGKPAATPGGQVAALPRSAGAAMLLHGKQALTGLVLQRTRGRREAREGLPPPSSRRLGSPCAQRPPWRADTCAGQPGPVCRGPTDQAAGPLHGTPPRGGPARYPVPCLLVSRGVPAAAHEFRYPNRQRHVRRTRFGLRRLAGCPPLLACRRPRAPVRGRAGLEERERPAVSVWPAPGQSGPCAAPTAHALASLQPGPVRRCDEGIKLSEMLQHADSL